MNDSLYYLQREVLLLHLVQVGDDRNVVVVGQVWSGASEATRNLDGGLDADALSRLGALVRPAARPPTLGRTLGRVRRGLRKQIVVIATGLEFNEEPQSQPSFEKCISHILQCQNKIIFPFDRLMFGQVKKGKNGKSQFYSCLFEKEVYYLA